MITQSSRSLCSPGVARAELRNVLKPSLSWLFKKTDEGRSCLSETSLQVLLMLFLTLTRVSAKHKNLVLIDRLFAHFPISSAHNPNPNRIQLCKSNLIRFRRPLLVQNPVCRVRRNSHPKTVVSFQIGSFKFNFYHTTSKTKHNWIMSKSQM